MNQQKHINNQNTSIQTKQDQLSKENTEYERLKDEEKKIRQEIQNQQLSLLEIATKIETLRTINAEMVVKTDTDNSRKQNIEKNLNDVLKQLEQSETQINQQNLSIEEKDRKLTYLRKATIERLKLIEEY